MAGEHADCLEHIVGYAERSWHQEGYGEMPLRRKITERATAAAFGLTLYALGEPLECEQAIATAHVRSLSALHERSPDMFEGETASAIRSSVPAIEPAAIFISTSYSLSLG